MTLPVLVLAGSRGPSDPLARHAGVAHKCLALVGGRPMLARVVATLAAMPELGPIALSLEAGASAEVGRALEATGEAPLVLPAAASPSLSVMAALDRLGTPLLVTTGDHPLLTAGILRAFLGAALAKDAAVVAGVVRRETIEAELPQTRRTYLSFKDGDVSGANLFLFKDDGARAAVAFWRRVERERKRPWRIAAAFGPRLLLAYLFRRLDLDAAMVRVGRVMGCRAAVVRLDAAAAAVDVDKPSDLVLAEAILAGRGENA